MQGRAAKIPKQMTYDHQKNVIRRLVQILRVHFGLAVSENLVKFTLSDPRADPRFCVFSARIIQKYPKNKDLDEDPHEDPIF